MIDLERAQRRLAQRRAAILARRGHARAVTEGGLSSPTGDDVGDVGDASQRDEATDLAARLSEGEWNTVHAIDDALERIRRGEYGICENCGEAIGAGRLEAIPEATTCVACASKLGQNEARPPRL
ncbi:MAG TPA: TraR/DksA C4-type zinc finger protein [Kofleriaceae bacterium]|nr:TraR/DksA C4-type zinc finger protein [Kofleriaceae bacterium]